MAFNSQQPPHGSAKPMPSPASIDDPAPNAAMLKGDINAGRTGDKNEVFDPGLSPLGTDEEAGGTPLKPEQVDLARHQESSARWQNGNDKDSYAHKHSRKALVGYVGFIGLVLVLFVGAFSMF